MSDFQRMNTNSPTPLAYIMDILYIQGSELAQRAHIDRTMVSRWKNGKLEFSMKSSCFEDIVNAILDINENKGLEILELFFQSVHKREIKTRVELQRCLVAWILEKDYYLDFAQLDSVEDVKKKNWVNERLIPVQSSDKDSVGLAVSLKAPDEGVKRTAVYRIYEGDAGRKDAFLQLQELFSSLSDTDRLWGYDTGINPFWGYVMAGLSMYTAHKPELITFHFLGRPTDEIYTMFANSLPCFFYTKSIAYYTYEKQLLLHDYVYSMMGKTVVYGDYDETKKELLYTTVHDDPVVIRGTDTFLQNLPQQFQPWFTRVYDWQKDAGFMVPGETLSSGMQYVLIEDIISFVFGTWGNLSHLKSNDFSENEKEYINSFFKGSRNLLDVFINSGGPVRIVMGYNSFLRLKEQKDVLLTALSRVLGRELYIPSEIIKAYLMLFLQKLNTASHIQIGLRPPNARPFLQACNVWIREDDKGYFFSERDASVRLITKEFTTIQALFQYCGKFWKLLPVNCTQVDWILRKLENL